MAVLTLSDLLEAIERHPAYLRQWEDGVPARESLRIILSTEPTRVRSEVFEARDGTEVVLDLDGEGKVAGIEIH